MSSSTNRTSPLSGRILGTTGTCVRNLRATAFVGVIEDVADDKFFTSTPIQPYLSQNYFRRTLIQHYFGQHYFRSTPIQHYVGQHYFRSTHVTLHGDLAALTCMVDMCTCWCIRRHTAHLTQPAHTCACMVATDSFGRPATFHQNWHAAPSECQT